MHFLLGIFLNHDQCQLSLTYEVFPNKSLPGQLADTKTLVELGDFHLHHKCVSWNYWLAPFEAIHTPKEELPCITQSFQAFVIKQVTLQAFV